MDTLPGIENIKSVKKVLISSFTEEGINVIESEFIPKVTEGQLLVKVHAAPINPLDLTKIAGKASINTLPFTPGSEASGIVIFPENHRGRKVSCYIRDGSFKQFAIVNEVDVLFFPDDADLDQIACAYVNPLTCIGMINTAKALKAKCIVNTAATSQLGNMLLRFSKQQGIESINLVRGEDKVVQYKEKHQAQYVLDIQNATFEEQFKQLANQLQATVCLDCYGGELSGRIFNSLPKNSHQFCYGSLISPYIDKVNGIDMRWNNKTYNGFVLFQYLGSLSPEGLKQVKDAVINNFNEVFSSQIHARIQLEKFSDGLNIYKKNMGQGKVILRMWCDYIVDEDKII